MDGRVTQSVTPTTLTRQRARFGAHGKFLRGATGDSGFNYLQVWAVDVVGGWFGCSLRGGVCVCVEARSRGRRLHSHLTYKFNSKKGQRGQ